MSKFVQQNPLRIFVVIATMLSLAQNTVADDVVFIRSDAGSNRTTRLSGKIVDWSGDGIIFERIGGRQQLIPPERITDVQTPWDGKHVEADRLFAQKEFEAALAKYRAAMSDEKRIWAKRKILASRVSCNLNLGNVAQAGDMFLAIVGNDPKTQHYNIIPLAWATPRPNAASENHAQTWLQNKNPAAKLLGASWLLSTRHRSDAIAALEQLTTSDDARIVFFAEAQIWRTRVISAKENNIAAWKTRIERMPTEIRAGPFFVLGQALARLEKHEDAAVSFMRIPILYPEQRQLSAEALTQAGRQLQSAGQNKEAAGLFREVLLDFSDTASAAVAQARLDALNNENK